MRASSTCNHTDTRLTEIGNYVAFLQVRVGQDVYIVAAGSSTIPEGAATFQLSCEPQVYDLVNDECTGAIPITDGNTTYEPARATDSYLPLPKPMFRDSWYTYTATCTGVATVKFLEINYSGVVVPYPNSCAATTYLSDPIIGLGSHNFPVTAGTSYLLRAGPPSLVLSHFNLIP